MVPFCAWRRSINIFLIQIVWFKAAVATMYSIIVEDWTTTTSYLFEFHQNITKRKIIFGFALGVINKSNSTTINKFLKLSITFVLPNANICWGWKVYRIWENNRDWKRIEYWMKTIWLFTKMRCIYIYTSDVQLLPKQVEIPTHLF